MSEPVDMAKIAGIYDLHGIGVYPPMAVLPPTSPAVALSPDIQHGVIYLWLDRRTLMINPMRIDVRSGMTMEHVAFGTAWGPAYWEEGHVAPRYTPSNPGVRLGGQKLRVGSSAFGLFKAFGSVRTRELRDKVGRTVSLGVRCTHRMQRSWICPDWFYVFDERLGRVIFEFGIHAEEHPAPKLAIGDIDRRGRTPPWLRKLTE